MRKAHAGGAWLVALRNRDVRLLVGAFAAVTGAEWMTAAAFAVHLYDVGGAAAVSLLAAFFIPTALASLGAGTLIELQPPDRVLVATALARALVIGGAAAGLALGWPLGVIVTAVAIDAVVAAAYRPAQAALLPVLARTPAELGGTAGLLSVTRTVCQAIGICLGGFLVATLPASEVFGVAAGLFTIAIALTSAHHARTEVVVARGGTGRADGSVVAAAREGLDALWEIARYADVRIVIGLAGIRSALRGAWLGVVVLAATGFLDMGREGVGELAAAAGVGALLSVPLSSRLVGSPRLATALGAGVALAGVALTGVAAFASPGAALVLLVAWGVGMAVADLCATAVLPRIVDARRFGQLTATMESFKQAAEGAGSLLFPLAAAALGTRSMLAAVGLLPPLVLLSAWRTLARVDASARRRVGRIEMIRHAPLLASLRVAELEAVAASVSPRHAAPGEEIIREGDLGARSYFVIHRGKAAVLADEHLLRTLGPGGAFGEIALLHGVQRTATVRALTGLDLLELDRADFIRALTGREETALYLRRERRDATLAERSAREVLPHVPWIARLGEGEQRDLAGRAKRRAVNPGEVLWTKGEGGETAVVVVGGQLAIGDEDAVLATAGPGECVGEIALLHDVPRTATVRAQSAAEVYELHREDVHDALGLESDSSALLIEQLA
jgi:CRP-like cAMP-binding protein